MPYKFLQFKPQKPPGVFLTMIGGLNIDITGKPLETEIPDNSNPGRINLSLGGVACNIARNLSRIYAPPSSSVPVPHPGIKVSFLTAIGDDILSAFALEKLKEEINLDISDIITIEKEQCGIYLSIVQGDKITAISDMSVTEKITPEIVEEWEYIIRKSNFVVMDTNLPIGSINAVLRITNKAEIPTLIQGVSVQKNEKLKELKHPVSYVSCNLKEYFSLSTILNKPGKSGITRGIIVTMGAMGAKFIPTAHSDYPVIQISAPKVKMANPNGAGDAFTAGFIYSLINNLTTKARHPEIFYIKEALYYGIALAYITLQSHKTVSEKLSRDTLERTLKRIKNNQSEIPN